ncbi:NAD(P)-dependent oxidoreductase [Niallia sp. 01092]|uniref:NAD(P)-dependent oxidoreductase n=1 Tax=unclassified Niallia TaxID=2837522 RepID=UPI003FD66778
MIKPKVLQILSMYHKDGEVYLQENADVIRTDDYRVKNICRLVEDVEAIVLRAPAKITKEIIDASPNLKVISGAGVGVDNIDVKYATEKGILVVHAPSVNKVSTAEHAVTLLTALSKNILSFHHEMKKGNYHSRTLIPTYELKGKKVGLIGFGSIAQEVAKRLSFGFEMDVTAGVREYDEKKHGVARELNVTVTTNLEAVFSQSDFVSLHIPLNEHTKNFVDKRLLSYMKPSSYLINTARGAVVNQDDLYHCLKNRKIAGAGIDVFDPEPPPKELPLLSLPNVIVTPHVGGTTDECNYIASTTISKNIIAILRGEKTKYLANPEVERKKRSQPS